MRRIRPENSEEPEKTGEQTGEDAEARTDQGEGNEAQGGERPEQTESAGEEETSQAEQSAEEDIEAVRQERDQLFERLRRMAADYENYKKRSQQNLQESVDLAKGEVLKSFLPVIDHFDRALAADPEQGDAKSVLQGLQMVRDEFLKTLEQAGAERLEPEPGRPLDPHVHEAMFRQPAEGVAPHHITACYVPGYVYNGRTLRPAKVAVAPEEDSGQGATEGSGDEGEERGNDG